MLDNSSKKILKFLVKECGEGNYKIIDLDDILLSQNKKNTYTKENLRQIISHLEVGNYISVKYSDEEQYCICTLPFGRQYIETIEDQEQNKKILTKLGKRNNLTMMLFAFLGSFMGTLLYYLLYFFK